MADLPVLPRRPRSDYVDPPARFRNRTNGAKRGWAGGWPDACIRAADLAELHVVRPLDGRVFTPPVDKRLAELFGAFLDYAQEFGYPLIGADEVNVAGGKQGGIGAVACRAIKGSDPPVASEHSRGTALDLYSRSNPQRRSASGSLKFWSTVHPLMVELAAAADIDWGGWYWDLTRGRYVDAMHFEYGVWPANVAESLRKLRAKADEIRKRLNPKPPPEVPPVKVEDVKAVQEMLNTLGTSPPLVVDGVYGDLTRSAVAGAPAMVAGQIDSAEEATKAAAVRAVQAVGTTVAED